MSWYADLMLDAFKRLYKEEKGFEVPDMETLEIWSKLKWLNTPFEKRIKEFWEGINGKELEMSKKNKSEV